MTVSWPGPGLSALARTLALVAGLLAFAFGATGHAQQGEKRLALIIANDAYTSPGLGALPGVRTDVEVMHPALRQAGFDVTVSRNLADKTGLQNAVSDFVAKLEAAGPNTVAFVYYTGHGVADARRGQNFLIPTTAQLRTLGDLPLQALPMNDMLDAIESVDNLKLALIVADACRNTPVALTRGDKGMVPVRNRADMLIAFATAPGETAEDNNLYSRTLAAELVRAGASTETVFSRAQSAVARASGMRQRPEFVSGLVEHVVFVEEAAASVAPAVSVPLRPQPESAATPVAGHAGRDCDGCPEMVVIPPGSFMMGSPANEAGREASEGPRRRVAIPAFAAGKYEVTWAEWEYCVADDGCPALTDDGFGKGLRPVTNVSWDDTKAYTRWLSRKTGKTYRLLSESEWEYVARAGTSGAYSWGGTASHEHANYGKDECCEGLASGVDRWVNTSAAGSFDANAFGLHDMHGNVWEWVEDCYDGSYSAGQPRDGRPFVKTSCPSRVLRGGSFVNGPNNVRSATRSGGPPSAQSGAIGFRTARTL